MGDIMRPVPFRELVERVFSEYRKEKSVFGIQEVHFFRKGNNRKISVFDEKCETPVGPAAGPHTQLAQNIIVSYLTGGRFMELKTVQKMDTLEIEKPCIDAGDEGYNTEWSTEYTLEKAYDEYIKAWVLLHFLESMFDFKTSDEERSFIFNMSVGYDLDGIKTPRMDDFINKMIDSTNNPLFQEYCGMLESIASDEKLFMGTGLETKAAALVSNPLKISGKLSPSVTLSTMHGCPPAEIEAICAYMLSEKKLDTYVKLNPTLLGFDRARGILDDLGYTYVGLNPESFDHDLQYKDAVPMLKRLIALAGKEGKQFGVKLSNTLGSVNDQGKLPGDEMYMSGRALYPLTITLAEMISKEFDGKLPISYAGGASAFNVKQIFEAGIHPITLATDLLKPGGYLRLKELAVIAEDSAGWDHTTVDVVKVAALAEEARSSAPYARKDFRGTKRVSVPGALPLFDCYVAPCVTACPINQDVPEYIRLAGEGRYKESLSVIYERNALPNITGHICDHQCQYNCTRLDYESSVKIRELKKIAAENGWEEYISAVSGNTPEREEKIAVIGAGPAGLSAACFLAREGFDVTVFEKHDSAGGVVRHVIPHFRLPVEAIEKDIEFIESHGVKFVFGADPEMTASSLKAEGFSAIFLGIGAEIDNDMKIQGDTSRVIPSLDFLGTYRKDPSSLSVGKRVVVVGGGNTAMDSARAAKHIPGVEDVTVLYRRTMAEMPADLEEYDNALKDGVVFKFLRNPEKMDSDGKISVRVMKLGDMDTSGRRSPVATDEIEMITADTIITAIGEQADREALKRFGIPMGGDGWPEVDSETLETGLPGVFLGGDAQTGPSTVVQCIAAGRRVSDALVKKYGGEKRETYVMPSFDEGKRRTEIISRRGKIEDSKAGSAEAARCLECSYVCDKCVEVCPNRANAVVKINGDAPFKTSSQVVHLDGLCNECGNCGTFCPWDGKPYKDKFTVFSLMEDFRGSDNPGFIFEGDTVQVRLSGKTGEYTLSADGKLPENFPDRQAGMVIEQIRSNYDFYLGKVGV